MSSRWKGVERGRPILGQVVRDPHLKKTQGVDKKEEEMLTGRESREGWKAGRGK